MSSNDRPGVAGVRDLRATDRVVQVAEWLVVLAVGGVAEHGSDELVADGGRGGGARGPDLPVCA